MTSKSPASLPIQYNNLAVDTQGPANILKQFKHSKMPHRLEPMRDKDEGICQVKALEDFTFLQGMVDGPLFSTPGGRPFSTCTVREYLMLVLSFCGLDTTQYKSHSFSIGAASDAALRGFLDVQIRLMGRWGSGSIYTCLPY